MLTWLKANHHLAPKEGESRHRVQVGFSSKLGPLSLDIKLQTMQLPNHSGSTVISRAPMPRNLGDIVEKALGDKLPKLVATASDKRVLLIDRQHISLAEAAILVEIERLAPSFPQLKDMDEVCIVDTSIWESEGWVYFRRFDDRGIVETMAFKDGALERRHNHGS